MTIALGKTPILIRQVCSVALAGAIPKGPSNTAPPTPTTVEYVPEPFRVGSTYGGGVIYSAPAEPALTALGQGGLFKFDEAALVHEVRGFCGSGETMDISVCDPGGGNSVVMAAAVSADSAREVFVNLVLLKNQELKITTSDAGTIDVYAVKADA